MTKHFVNLTNGLDWVDDLPEFSFVRVESTAIEKNDWTRLFRDLDANFLMSLALGRDCHFYDCGTRRLTSKTVSIGVPKIRETLTKWWTGEPPTAKTEIEREMKRKIMYFRRYLNTSVIRLTGHSKPTENDGDKVYYRGIAVKI